MATDISTLGIEVKSDSVGTATDRLNNLSKAGGTAEDSTNKVSAAFDKLGYSTQSLVKYIEAAVGALALMKLADLAKDAALLTARYDTLGIVMQVTGKNAAYTASQMGEFQASLQKTGISALESRQGLIRMGQAQIDMANSAKLARVAQDAAVVGNINSSEAFERMMTGLATGQSIILHHLGLMTNFEQAYIHAADAMGKTTKDLSETEKAQIRVNEVMRASVGIQGAYEAAMGTVGKQLTSLPRYIQDLMVKVGEFGQGPLYTIVKSLGDSLKYLNTNFEQVSATASTIGGSGAIVAFGVLSSKAVDYANALALASQHSQALRMNTVYDAEADVKRTASISAVSAEELRRAEILQAGVIQERESAVAKLQAVSANDALVASELSVAEVESAQATARTTRITSFLAQIAAESEALAAKSTRTKADIAFENELRNQEFTSRNRLIVAMSEQSAADAKLAQIQTAATRSTQARTVALTELAAVSKDASIAESQLAAATSAVAAAEAEAAAAAAALTAAEGAASTAGMVMTGVMSGLTTAMSLVGGEIGLIAIAIAGITYEIYKFLHKAEEAQIKLMQLQNQGDFAQTLAKLKEIEDLNRQLEKDKKSPADLAKDNTAQMQEKINKAVKENVDLERQRQALVASGNNKTASETWTGKITEWDKVNTKIKDNNNLIEHGMQVNKEMNTALAKQAELRKALHPDKPADPVVMQDADEYGRDLRKSHESYLHYVDEYNKRLIAGDKNALDIQLNNLKEQKEQQLITEREFAQSVLDAKVLELTQAQAVDERKYQSTVAYAARIDAALKPKKDGTFGDGFLADGSKVSTDDLNKANKAAETARIQNEAAATRLTIAKDEQSTLATINSVLDARTAKEMEIQKLQAQGDTLGARELQNLLKYADIWQRTGNQKLVDAAREIDNIQEENDLYARQAVVRQEIAKLEQENAAKAASLVGVNPATGGIDSIADQLAHDLALQKNAHEEKLRIIGEEQEAALLAYSKSSKSAEDYAMVIGRLNELKKGSALEEKDNANKNAAITKKAYDSQLQAVSYYTGLAGGLFNELAGAMDKTNRSGFEAAKAFSLAATTVNTAAAVMNALATVQPYPAAIAAAAAAAATGAIQLGLIASTEFGGGGSVSAPGSFSGSVGGGASSAGSSIGPDIKYGSDATSSDSMVTLADSAKSASLAVGDLASAFKKATDSFSKGGIGGNIIDRLMELAAHPATNVPLINAMLIAQDKQFSGGLSTLMQSNLALIDKAATALGTSTSGKPNIQPKMWDGGEWNKENVTKFFNEFLTGTMNDYAKTVKGLEEFAKPGEDAAAALQRLSSALYDTNKQFDKLGINLLSGLGGANIASKFQDAFTAKGEDFHKALDSYFTGLFTDEQQKAMTAAAAQREVQAGFDQMHISVPQTKADFIALVNSLNLTTESGQSTFATLMSLAESFGKVQDQAEAMHKAQLALNQDAQVRLLNATDQTDAGTILALQIQQATELADAQTKGLDTGALVLAQQAEMAQAQQKIADTAAAATKALNDSRQKLQIQILNLSGDTAGATALQRQMELAAMDASLRPLQERIYALQDEAAAAKIATDAAKAAQDAVKKATTDAMAVLQKSVTAAKTAAQSVYDAQIAGIDAAKQAQADAFKVQEKAAQDYVSKLQTVAGSIKSTLDGLTAPGSDTLMARKFAESQISMYARSGRLPMNGELDGALKTISQPSEGLFSSSVDYRRDYAKTAADLTTLNNRAQGQLTNAQLQLQAMQDANDLANKAFDAQAKAAKDAFDQQNAALDATLAKAQAQIDAVNGTTVAVMSVDAAINNLAAALQAQSPTMHLINPTLSVPNTPSFAVGNPYVSQDMNANIHQGEIVMDRMSAEVLRRYGIPTNGAADNRELILEVKALRSDLRAANGEIAAANKKMARYIERWDGDGMPDVRTA